MPNKTKRGIVADLIVCLIMHAINEFQITNTFTHINIQSTVFQDVKRKKNYHPTNRRSRNSLARLYSLYAIHVR